MAKRICKCGCGQELPLRYSESRLFIHGHRNAAKLALPRAAREEDSAPCPKSMPGIGGLLEAIEAQTNEVLLGLTLAEKIALLQTVVATVKN